MKLPACLLALLVCTAASLAAADRPNLVIVMTDEHNLRTIGCYRELMSPEQAFVWGDDVEVKTPHIDSIAQAGALHTNFYVSTPVCSPSRAAFLTGKYPHQVGVPTNDLPMYDDTVTIAEVLGREGYATSYIGKWHLDGTGKPQWEPERKFGWQDNRYMFNRGHYKNLKETADGPRVNAPMGKDGIPRSDVGDADEKSYTTDFLMDRTLEFIRREQEGPFAVMLSLPDPHGPNHVRPPYDKMYEHLDFQEPRTMFKSADETPGWSARSGNNYIEDQELNPAAMAAIFGMVKCIDDNIGRLLSELESLDLTDNTIVVFTSDHGDLMGEHRRHNKGVPYDMSARVAFLVKQPGVVPAGKRIDATMTSADFGPTMLSLLGAEHTLANVPGRDFALNFRDGRSTITSDRSTYIRASTVKPNWLAVTDSRHKLVISDQDEPWLFDLKTDPDELKNYITDPDYAEIRQRLTHDLRLWMERVEEPALDDPTFTRWL
ncbi:sulfatase-like hydrolase/transferase [Opitutaceae bacterium]|nr:sulfatase-like hydrolase/transferase [Opitutaceae bacterium]